MGIFDDEVSNVIVDSTLAKISSMSREQLEDLVIYLIKNYSVTHLIISKLKEYSEESVDIIISLEEENPGSAEIIDSLFEEINRKNEENNAKHSDSQDIP